MRACPGIAAPLVAFRLQAGEYVEQDVSSRRIYSPALDLDLVVHNDDLRLSDPQALSLFYTPKEEADGRKLAEAELDRAIAGRSKAVAMRKNLEAESDRLRREIEAIKQARWPSN